MGGVSSSRAARPTEDEALPLRNARATDAGRRDWSAWPLYDAAVTGLREYWYPVAWSCAVTNKPLAIVVCGESIVVLRRDGQTYALRDRCLHRGVPLSLGSEEFPGTLTCAYHGWTYDVRTGRLVAVITDGPDSPICGKVVLRTYPTAEQVGLVWVYMGDEPPPPPEEALPEELRAARFSFGGRMEVRQGNWRLAAENGFDEGHAKFLHRRALWRNFKTMPTWTKIHISQEGRWIYRCQDEVHWSADFPGLGHWTNLRWWRLKPQQSGNRLGNMGRARRSDPEISRLNLPGFASLTLPGVLRIAYPKFIHYEFYVPLDAGAYRYVGLYVRFKLGLAGVSHRLKYLGFVRWLFHGQFSAQDAWMVSETHAPPERLYRPDVSIVAWRRLVERESRRGSHEEELLATSASDKRMDIE